MPPDTAVPNLGSNAMSPAPRPPNRAAPVSKASRVEATFTFLLQLWPNGLPPGTALVVSNRGFSRNRRMRCIWAAALALALTTACYFSCALMPVTGAGRGLAPDTLGIPGIGFDLDLKGGKHKEKNLPTFEQAFAFLRELPYRPTLVLDSGGGLYVWWLFKEPWLFESAAERERAARIVKQWHAYVRGRAAAHGWNLDDTSPLSQVLRPEGAYSHKYDPPALVQRVISAGPRWNPCDFEEWYPAEPTAQAGTRSKAVSTEMPRDLPPSIAKAVQGLGRPAIEKRKQTGQLHAVVLGTCPACKGVQTTEPGVASYVAHVAPLSGALRCKRQTCDAHEGRDGGLAFKVWVPRFLSEDLAREVLELRAQELRALHPEVPIPALHADGVDEVDLAQADGGRLDKCLDDAIMAAKSKRVIALGVVPTGVGKTRAILPRLSRQPSAYFAQTHDQLSQVAAQLRARGVPYIHVLGVGKTCRFGEAYLFYGERSDWRGTACQTCAHRVDGTCDAWRPIPLDVVILATHQSLAVLAKMRTRDPLTGRFRRVLDGRLLVIDEAMQSIDVVEVEADRIHAPLENPGIFGAHSAVAERCTSMLDLLLARARREREANHEDEYPTHFHGDQLRALFEDATRHIHSDDRRTTIQLASGMPMDAWPKPPGWQLRDRALDRDRWPHPDVFLVWKALEGVAGDSPRARQRAARKHGVLEVVATDKSARIELRRRMRIPMGKYSGVVMLDATGNLTRNELQAANPKTPIEIFGLKVRPDPAARVKQLFIQTNGVTRRQLLDKGKLTERGIGTIRNALRQAEAEARAHIGGPGCTCSLISFMDIDHWLQGGAGPLTAVTPRGLLLRPERIGHYWCDERGSNRFTGMQVHITFGDPRQNLGALDADARALGLDANKLARARTAATLVQAQGRSRALRAKGPVLQVHVGTVVPPDWTGHTTVPLQAGRPPAPVRATVAALVAGLLAAGEIVAVPIILGLLEGQIPLPDPLANTAIRDTVESSFGQSPMPAGRSLTRWVGAAARACGVRIAIVVRDAKWTVWKPVHMSEEQAKARAVAARDLLRSVGATPRLASDDRSGASACAPDAFAVPVARRKRQSERVAADPAPASPAAEVPTPTDEVYEERAAVLEFEAGLGRAEAESRARDEADRASRSELRGRSGRADAEDRACA